MFNPPIPNSRRLRTTLLDVLPITKVASGINSACRRLPVRISRSAVTRYSQEQFYLTVLCTWMPEKKAYNVSFIQNHYFSISMLFFLWEWNVAVFFFNKAMYMKTKQGLISPPPIEPGEENKANYLIIITIIKYVYFQIIIITLERSSSTGQVWPIICGSLDDGGNLHDSNNFNIFVLQFQELCNRPVFVNDAPAQFDISPGKMGDRWLVSCLGVLYLSKGLFYRVVPADQNFSTPDHYAGVFRFRLWWCGEWVEVLVDDRLPTVHGRLAFLQSTNSDQFWPGLLEKAYAK